MNVEKLEGIIKAIEAEPLRLDMGDWGYVVAPNNASANMAYPPCGTVGCIAGWAVYLSDADLQKTMMARAIRTHQCASLIGVRSVPEEAQELLDLTDYQANVLFFADAWPLKFRWAYLDARTPEDRVKVTVARIRHMIETEE